MKNILYLFLAFGFSLSNCLFAKGPGTTAASFLKIGVGARNIAMGETGAAGSDVNSIYWNPAGLAELGDMELSFMHAMWLQEISYEHLAFGYPTKAGTFGLGADYLSMKGIGEYDVNDTALDTAYKPADMAWTLSYARKLGEVGLGANLKYISSKLENETAAAVAGDIGAAYGSKLRIGLAIQNFGGKMKFVSESDPLPLNIKAGGAYELFSDENSAVSLALDVNKPSDNDIYENIGAEYTRKLGKDIGIACRAGYKTNIKGYDAISGLSAGAGFNFQAYRLDFAWVPYDDLGDTYRFSLTAKFGSGNRRTAATEPSGVPAGARKTNIPTAKNNMVPAVSIAPAAIAAVKETPGTEVGIWLMQLKSSDWQVRRKAAFELGRTKAARGVGPLLELMEDENNKVCATAVLALGRIGDKRALLPLIERLMDEAASVRASAAKALGDLGDKRAVKPLRQTLKDNFKQVRQAAENALKRLEGE